MCDDRELPGWFEGAEAEGAEEVDTAAGVVVGTASVSISASPGCRTVMDFLATSDCD